MREGEQVSPLELFFDLVFVLAITQCTQLMSDHPTWEGLAQGLLVLGLLWWSWVGYSWLTSVVDPEEDAVRLIIFAAMAGMLIVALAVPDAFGGRGLEFALAYGVVRAAHIGLFMLASRDEPGLRHSVVGARDQHRARRVDPRRWARSWTAARRSPSGRSRSPSTWEGRSSSTARAGGSCPPTSPSATG